MENESNTTTQAVFYITHNGMFQRLLARLGIAHDPSPLTAEYDEDETRHWRLSHTDPFGANLAVVLYKYVLCLLTVVMSDWLCSSYVVECFAFIYWHNICENNYFLQQNWKLRAWKCVKHLWSEGKGDVEGVAVIRELLLSATVQPTYEYHF